MKKLYYLGILELLALWKKNTQHQQAIMQMHLYCGS